MLAATALWGIWGIREGSAGAGRDGIDCVFLTCFESELEVYTTLLRPSGIRIHTADTLERAEFLLIVTGATVVLSDALFLDGTWEEAANLVERLHPYLGLVVALPAEAGVARAEVSRAGLRVVIEKPFGMGTLRAAIQAAHNSALKRVGMPTGQGLRL